MPSSKKNTGLNINDAQKSVEEKIKLKMNRARSYAIKVGMSEDADDFASFVAEKFLNNPQSIYPKKSGFLFIDYLRETYGDSRTISGKFKQTIGSKQTVSYDDARFYELEKETKFIASRQSKDRVEILDAIYDIKKRIIALEHFLKR